jgi:hypothetical protein
MAPWTVLWFAEISWNTACIKKTSQELRRKKKYFFNNKLQFMLTFNAHSFD